MKAAAAGGRAFVKAHKGLIRYWIPQGVRDYLNRITGNAIEYRGVYADWESASAAVTGGYSAKALFTRLEEAALAVKRGEGVWEQDGVVYDSMPADFPLPHCLARVALVKGRKLTVLDYGGAFGSSFHQCRALLPEVSQLKWVVVEQPHIVESGRRNFQTAELQFEDNLDRCLARDEPDIVLLSSVLQYLQQPYELLARLGEAAIEYLIIDRHPCSLTTELITIQVVPPGLYSASYPSWLFDCNRVAATLGRQYELLLEWDGKDPPIYGKGIGAKFKGSFWRKRSTT